MENQQEQQPAFARRHSANVVNGDVSSQNSHGIRGTQQSPDEEMSDNSHSQHNSNADDVALNSLPISAENFHADSPADMVNIIDQIMGRQPPLALDFPDDGSGFPADSSHTSMNNNMPPNGNYNGLVDNQTQTAPLYNAATSLSSSGTHSASLSSNYIFPVDDMMQQSSMYASSNGQTNWQGNSPGNRLGQHSVISPTLLSTQSYNSFQTNASTIPNNRPGTSSLPGGSISPGTYNSSSQDLSGSNARQVASFGNSGRRATFGSGTSARIGLEFNNFTSSETQSAHSVSSTSGGSTGSISSSSLENHLHQMLPSEESTCNRIYDHRHAELGIPVDPYLRMFTHTPEFWKNVHGNGDVPKK